MLIVKELFCKACNEEHKQVETSEHQGKCILYSADVDVGDDTIIAANLATLLVYTL
jgi:hypothetical protein